MSTAVAIVHAELPWPHSADGVRRRTALRRARVHSFVIRALRIVLPLATVGCLGFYLIGAELAFRVGDVEVRATPTLVTGEKVRMENPRLTGFTEDRGAYVVTAASATHEFANPDLIALETINAKLTEADDGWSEVVAAAGLFDRTAKRLKLSGGIRLKTSEGLNAALLTADYLIDANRLSSAEPVTVEMPSAIVKSGALAVDSKIKRVVFSKRVVSRLKPSAAKPAAAVPAAATAASQFGISSDLPIDITSTLLTIDDTSKLAEFEGPVVAVQGPMALRTRLLKVTYAGDAVADGVGSPATPAGAAAEIVELFADGEFSVASDDGRQIEAAWGRYERLKSQMSAGGGVLLIDGANRIAGPTMTYDLERRFARFPVGGRVKAQFVGNAAGQTASSAKKKRAVVAGGDLLAARFSGFAADGGQPTAVESDQLEFDELKGLARFSGKVAAVQGGNTIKSKELDVVVEAASANGVGATAGGIRRLEARGDVVVIAPDQQSAKADKLVYDPLAETLTLLGRVVVVQGEQVVKGTKLVVDLKTGRSKLETGGAKEGSGLVAVDDCPPGRVCLRAIPRDFQDRMKKQKSAAPTQP